jgi:nucleolar protein 6
MGKSTSSSSKKRSRAPEEDVVDSGDSAAAVKKSKIDATGKAEVTKNGAVSESPAKKDKKEKKDKKDKEGRKEKKSKDVTADASEEVEEELEEKKAKKEKKEKKSKEDKEDKKAKKDKKSKKDKSQNADDDVEMTNGHSTPAAPETNGHAAAATETPSKKSKKDKKDKKEKKSKKSKTDSNGTAENGDEEPAAADKEPEATTADGAKGTRFICFIGNLPYSATVESITAHFATVHPTSVRMLTERENPAKSKGIAFVEFGRFDHMKTCLEKFHHTEFDDGISPARKINVELTYVLPSTPPPTWTRTDRATTAPAAEARRISAPKRSPPRTRSSTRSVPSAWLRRRTPSWKRRLRSLLPTPLPRRMTPPRSAGSTPAGSAGCRTRTRRRSSGTRTCATPRTSSLGTTGQARSLAVVGVEGAAAAAEVAVVAGVAVEGERSGRCSSAIYGLGGMGQKGNPPLMPILWGAVWHEIPLSW